MPPRTVFLIIGRTKPHDQPLDRLSLSLYKGSNSYIVEEEGERE